MTPGSALPLSLYVHLPWCVRKCPYCDFNSHAAPAAGIPQHAYLAAVLDDLEFAASGLPSRPLESIFFGGGTPSLFEAESIAGILRRAREVFPLTRDPEVTLEANPGTIEHGRFSAYREAGVNRVSLGAQSFDDRHLAALGRIHSHGDTVAAVAELRDAGLANFNLDLMYALPQQTLAEARRDVQRAIDLAPSHISHYQLTLEPGTVFERRPPPLPDDDACYEMQVACQELLAGAGYRQYEVSAWARPGWQCRHNLNYWRFGDYVGIGAGAHGKITDPATGRVLRTARVRQPARYMAAATRADRVEESRVVPPGELPFEFCLNVLRLVEGFDRAAFESRTGLAWTCIETPLAEARERGLMDCHADGRWAASALGRRFLNDLQAMFLERMEPRRHLRPGGGIASSRGMG